MRKEDMTDLDRLMTYGDVQLGKRCGGSDHDEYVMVLTNSSGQKITLRTTATAPGASPSVTLINAMLTKLESNPSE